MYNWFIYRIPQLVCLKKTYNFIFKTTNRFSDWFRNKIKKQIISIAFNRSFLLHFFLFKLIHIIIIGLQSSSSISLLTFYCLSFNSLSFNSMKYFSKSKRLFLTFKNHVFRILFKYFVLIFSFICLNIVSIIL